MRVCEGDEKLTVSPHILSEQESFPPLQIAKHPAVYTQQGSGEGGEARH